MENLLFTLNAVLPIVLCIVIGYFIKLLKIFPDDFWSKLNKLCFRVLLPVLLFKNIYDIDNIALMADYWKVILFSALTIIGIFFIGLLIVILFIKDPKQKGVILQCIFRSNYAIIGIGLIELLSSNFTGDSKQMAIGIGAIISAISIPIFNILAIISLSLFVHEEEKKTSAKDIFIKICKNPLIIGVLTGILVLLIRLLIPVNEMGEKAFSIKNNLTFLYTAIKWLAQSASPVALIALGGAFSFSAVAKLKYKIILGTTIRVIFVPFIALTLAFIFKFDKIYFPALIALFGTPVAVSSVPMSQELGNDSELAGQLVVWTTISSAFTLFIIILISSSIGLL
jgi:predicted permease